jgi:hypothetical protein
MKRASLAGVCTICLAAAIGCGRSDGETATSRTGCLTTSGETFVLTDIERGESPSTEAFRLEGHENELRPHIGQRVRITGDAEPAKVAVVRESTPPDPNAQPAGTSGGATPNVSTATEARVEVRKLTVASVEPTGQTCAAEVK